MSGELVRRSYYTNQNRDKVVEVKFYASKSNGIVDAFALYVVCNSRESQEPFAVIQNSTVYFDFLPSDKKVDMIVPITAFKSIEDLFDSVKLECGYDI